MTVPTQQQQVLIEVACDCGFKGHVTAFEKRAARDLYTVTWFCPRCGAGHTHLREISTQSKPINQEE